MATLNQKRITATIVPPVDRTVTLSLPESEAAKLQGLLMSRVDWYEDHNGQTAKQIWEALDDLGVKEA